MFYSNKKTTLKIFIFPFEHQEINYYSMKNIVLSNLAGFF